MTKKEEKNPRVSKFAIVNFIMKQLGIGDMGILDKFCTREVKTLNRNIKILKGNKSALTLQFEVDSEELKGKIEDAKEELVKSYIINPDQIRDNKHMESFRTSYWNNISYKKDKIKVLNQDLIDLTDDYEENIKGVQSDIQDLEESIKAIKEFNIQ